MKTSILNLEDLTINSDKVFLIIEDEKLFNEYVVESLILLGFNGKFLQAYNLQEASEYLEKERVDFIICDWNLPDGEGFTLLKAVRKLKRFHETPFLMITANDDVDSMLKSSRYGSSEYLVKPFEVSELKDKIIGSWRHHMFKNEDHVEALKREIKNLKDKILTLEDENLRMKNLLKGLSK